MRDKKNTLQNNQNETPQCIQESNSSPIILPKEQNSEITSLSLETSLYCSSSIELLPIKIVDRFKSLKNISDFLSMSKKYSQGKLICFILSNRDDLTLSFNNSELLNAFSDHIILVIDEGNRFSDSFFETYPLACFLDDGQRVAELNFHEFVIPRICRMFENHSSLFTIHSRASMEPHRSTAVFENASPRTKTKMMWRGVVPLQEIKKTADYVQGYIFTVCTQRISLKDQLRELQSSKTAEELISAVNDQLKTVLRLHFNKINIDFFMENPAMLSNLNHHHSLQLLIRSLEDCLLKLSDPPLNLTARDSEILGESDNDSLLIELVSDRGQENEGNSLEVNKSEDYTDNKENPESDQVNSSRIIDISEKKDLVSISTEIYSRTTAKDKNQKKDSIIDRPYSKSNIKGLSISMIPINFNEKQTVKKASIDLGIPLKNLDFGSKKIKRKGFNLLSVSIAETNSPQKSPTKGKSIHSSAQKSVISFDEESKPSFDIKEFLGHEQRSYEVRREFLDQIIDRIAKEREPLSLEQTFNLYNMLDLDVTDLIECIEQFIKKRSMDSIYSSIQVLSTMTINGKEGSIMSPTRKKRSKYYIFKSLLTFLKNEKGEIQEQQYITFLKNFSKKEVCIHAIYECLFIQSKLHSYPLYPFNCQ